MTHIWWASVMEGVSSGVPMVCRPFFGNQKMNVLLVSHVWGFGMAFDRVMTCDGVATVMVSPVGGKDGCRMRARAQELQAKVATMFIEPNGNCRKNFARLVEIICAS
jgi:anthocyanidin 3-O-glucosyltransferase